MELAQKTCPSCDGQTPVLSASSVAELLKQLNGWHVESGKFLQKTFAFKNFAQSLKLANEIGAIAEEQNHHPDLLVRWGELQVKIWTHAVDALTESDFIIAAKIDSLSK